MWQSDIVQGMCIVQASDSPSSTEDPNSSTDHPSPVNTSLNSNSSPALFSALGAITVVFVTFLVVFLTFLRFDSILAISHNVNVI
ncbi:hypothetical protein L596_029531 [Steinernema carpocapsae]|uniref:Uncharacterized protein n=1 Tax=Steinernema carpocapsae TaxID=34508 RepID=A0A4U5LUW9_STECR|nr:hypothetical protein L596_029531 [Steinernema carpocapsae]